jgi:SPP1 gp7 family putative phage head morphogenesis protein
MSIFLDAFNLAPKDAIAFLQKKGYRFSWDYTEVWEKEHAHAFTVAKVMRADILQDIKDALDSSLQEGKSFQKFQKELRPLLQAKGWWGQKMMVDEKGQGELVQLGSPFRLKTIYQTNMQSALMKGRYDGMMQAVDSRPFWQYIAIMDNRVRPDHAALNGMIFRYDDPFWNTHYPPNGYRCRCRVRTLSQREVDRMGLSVTDSDGLLVDKEVLVSKRTGLMTTVTGIETTGADGQPTTVFTDPGFNYNQARVPFKPDLTKYDPSIVAQYEKEVKKGPKQ